MAALDPLKDRIAQVRRFNRFYTRRIGVLQAGLLASPYSLTEVRVLYELAHRDTPTAAQLCRDLGLDAGYLSRLLRGFVRRGLVAAAASKADARRTDLRLTAKGARTLASLEKASDAEVATMLGALGPRSQTQIVGAMRRIETLLERGAAGRPARRAERFNLRSHRPGDIGWVISAHGEFYAREFGWDASFEALVAQIAAEFVQKFDPQRERCWIAEKDGERVGSVFLVQKSKTVAKLRLLIVDPRARGLGVGKRLVDVCIEHARALGYRKLTLWTQSQLLAARGIYAAAGFKLTGSEPHHSFGIDLVGETWDLVL